MGWRLGLERGEVGMQREWGQVDVVCITHSSRKVEILLCIFATF